MSHAKKLPHIPWYIGDWLKDPQVSICSPATRGIWMDLICAMHECDRSGELRGTSEQLARLARCSTVELVQALTELRVTQAADIEQRNGGWAVANRRMRREAEIRGKRALAGSVGGSKTSAKHEQKPDTDNDIECLRIIEAFCIEKGLPKSDGTACFHKWQGNGWTNGGKPMKCWRSTILSWRAAGYLPSQKPGGKGSVPPPKEKRDVSDQFKSWAMEKYPGKREEIAGWKTQDQVNSGVWIEWIRFKQKQKEQ